MEGRDGREDRQDRSYSLQMERGKKGCSSSSATLWEASSVGGRKSQL
jgi:hypothetical protein